MSEFEPVIGLEIHIELKTASKMFCGCGADWFGKEPNTLTCPVCLGLPGALPVANRQAIEWVVKLGLAMGCNINLLSKFDRKHYSYPDLPKGYQISQYDVPFCVGGKYEILDSQLKTSKVINIRRIHMEEDTGKLTHIGNKSYVDYNRSGVPLVEIVTEPDFNDSTQVKQFLEELQVIVKYLDISDVNMEEGSMRLEPNISVRKVPSTELPNYKVEVKNINSFKFAKDAIDYEVERHIEILKQGKTPPQETRGFDVKTHKTVPQRLKEDAHDYRYFPEPDVPPIRLEKSYVEGITANLPELPHQKLRRLVEKLHLRHIDAYILTRDDTLCTYFEQICAHILSGHIKGIFGDKSVHEAIAHLIINKRVSVDQSVDAFVVEALELLKPVETDEAGVDKAIDEVINQNPDAVLNYKGGNTGSIMFLVGQVMKAMNGKADAQLVRSKLEEIL